jgi:hypothetical protein
MRQKSDEFLWMERLASTRLSNAGLISRLHFYFSDSF